jgi:hypothetical protein
MLDWLVLTASLPTAPSGLRVRIWRALKATGCATLREGVYILPASASVAADLWAIEKAIRAGGASAHMLKLQARNAAQEKQFRALFDRAELYADFTQTLKVARKTVRQSGEAALRKLLRGLDQQLQSIRSIDHLPGAASAGAVAGLDALRAAIEKKLSPGEPAASARAIQRLDRASFQGRTWATRQRPWLDRLATAWLVQRFIDARPRFVWLSDPKKCPKSAIGYDFDGAHFTHVGDKVSFEVVVQAFGLDADAALQRLGELVHYLDIGGMAVDEAAGVETIIRGLQAQHADDDALLAASCAVFDSLYAALRLAH